MQASKAQTETRVPRQIAARLERSIARYAPPGEPDTPNPAANDAPANQPAPTAATPANPPADPPVDPRHATPEYWKQRFEVTSGLLAKARQERIDERDSMNSRFTELQTEIQTLKAAAPAPEIDLSTLFTKEQIETYGEEQCRVMAQTASKAATAEAQKLIDAAVRPLQDRQKQEATNEAEARQRKFVDQLIELVPDYQDTDKDQRWLDWLDTEDEHGATRQSILDAHVRAGNARGAAKMFKAFGKTIEVPTPTVAPSGSGAGVGDGAPPAQQGLTAPTDAEVKDFYKRAALNKVSDSERVTFEARRKLRNPGR